MAQDGDLERLVQQRVQQKLGDQPRRLLDGTIFPLGDPRGTSKSSTMAPGVVHSRGEASYSLKRLLLAQQERDWTRAPLEYAISEKPKQAGYTSAYGGVMVPWGSELFQTAGHEQDVENLALEIKHAFAAEAIDPGEVTWLRRRMGLKAMDPLDETAGGSLVGFPQLGELIGLLRPLTVFSRAGARQISLAPSGSVSFPSSVSDPTFSWLPSNTPIPASDPGTGAMTMMAHRYAGLVKIPRTLLSVTGSAAETLVRDGLVGAAAVVEDQGFLSGTGSTGMPLGITKRALSVNDTPAKGKVTLHQAATQGAGGNTFGVSDPDLMVSLVEEAPDPAGISAWVMYPRMFQKLSSARADAVVTGDGAGVFLFNITRGTMGGAVPKELLGTPVIVSTQVERTMSKGSTTTGLTFVLAGNFSRAFVGRTAALEIAASLDAGFEADQLWLRAVGYADLGLSHPECFVLCPQLLL